MSWKRRALTPSSGLLTYLLVFPVEAADAAQPLISVLLYLCNVAVLFLHTTAWWPWVWLTLAEYKRIQSSHSIYRLLFSIIIEVIVLKHASAKLHFISVIVSSSPEAKNWDFLLSESHNLHSSARLVGRSAADRDRAKQCFSTDSSPAQQIERLRIPLTDVCDHCSSEIKWKGDGRQRFNSQSSSRSWGSLLYWFWSVNIGLWWKEAPSSGWMASFHASGSWGRGVDMLQTRDGWISLWVHGKVHSLNNWV